VALRTTSRSQERLKAYRRANKAVIARIDEKKITDLAISVVPSCCRCCGNLRCHLSIRGPRGGSGTGR
jgi:hypothetical protein